MFTQSELKTPRKKIIKYIDIGTHEILDVIKK